MGPRGFLTEEEKKNMPKVSGALIRRILSYLTPYWPQFLLVFVTILVSALLGLLPSIITTYPGLSPEEMVDKAEKIASAAMDKLLGITFKEKE